MNHASLMNRRLPWLAAAALSLLAVSAGAQTKAELAARVVKLQQPAIDSMARGIAGDTAQRVLQAAGQALAAMPNDIRQPLGKQIEGDVKGFYDEIEPKLRESAARLGPTTIGPMLEERFSEEELKQVAAWLDSSAAKKFQQLGGEMQTQMSRKLIEDTRGTIEPRLKVLEQTLQKRFAQSAAAAASAAAASAPAGKPAPAPAKPASAPAAKAPIKK